MKQSFEAQVALFANRNNIPVTWQDLRFGFRRAVLPFDSYGLFTVILALCSRKRGWNVSLWTCHEGVFEGYIYLMDMDDHKKLSDLLAEEKQKHDDWWQRYHNADEETRKLMACEAIP